MALKPSYIKIISISEINSPLLRGVVGWFSWDLNHPSFGWQADDLALDQTSHVK